MIGRFLDNSPIIKNINGYKFTNLNVTKNEIRRKKQDKVHKCSNNKRYLFRKSIHIIFVIMHQR